MCSRLKSCRLIGIYYINNLIVCLGEQNFLVAVAGNLALGSYFWLRVNFRNIIAVYAGAVDYDVKDLMYIVTMLYSTFGTYVVIWIRKELLLENIKNKRESENWKALLMMLKEAVVVCGRNS
ncbi:MAG: hypothetical protein P4M11_07640, partial [Candidatus Pacebacteria bacterium]|nr:hypothetical protein [Candidatus Paceibacterota bacterium]